MDVLSLSHDSNNFRYSHFYHALNSNAVGSQQAQICVSNNSGVQNLLVRVVFLAERKAERGKQNTETKT